MSACNCTGRCKVPPYTCSGLTYDSGYPAQMRYNWGYEPWVIESWRKASEANGWDKTAERIRNNLKNAIKDANEKSTRIPSYRRRDY